MSLIDESQIFEDMIDNVRRSNNLEAIIKAIIEV